MEKFEINILGCGSALPTMRHLPSAQVVNFRDKLFMVDCGEGTQLQLRRMRLKFSRLGHLFLSHMHGDHCFGLPGLLSTLGLLGRTGEFVIHAHPDAEKVFRPMLDYFCKDLPFEVRFDSIDPLQKALIYEDKSLEIYSLPLKHRVATCGFLFKEKPKERHLRSDMISFWKIPIKALQAIKEGADWVTPDGDIVPNAALTKPAEAARSYAYCSDTAYYEKLIPHIEGVDLLYHEATFAEDAAPRAKETFHSTARQAATIAQKAGVKQLMIGHYSARYEDDSVLQKEAKEIFPTTILAKEGLKYAL
ncbi:MAG: ribonuclease Z [Bacteroidales bacterium]